jgi:hypothetical protein
MKRQFDSDTSQGSSRKSNSNIQKLKRGGRVKIKAKPKGGRAKASAVANVTINMGKRGGGNRAPRPSPKFPLMGASQGNMALENQFARLFNQIQSNLVPKNQGQPVAPPERELPEQQRNIVNLQDLADNPSIAQFHADQTMAQLNRAGLLRNYPEESDIGDPSQMRFNKALSGITEIKSNELEDEINRWVAEHPRRMTELPTSSQIEIFGKSPVGYYNQFNKPRKHGPDVDEYSYQSMRTGLPKVKKMVDTTGRNKKID